MKLSDPAIIAKEKLTEYLLKWQPENDKSKFLEKAGYTQALWQQLADDIRKQIFSLDAKLIRKTPYGDMHEIRGFMTGPNGVSLKVVTVWMAEYKTHNTKFITLYPDEED